MKRSLMQDLLLAFIPFTEENIKFSSNPRKFLNHLSEKYSVKPSTVSVTLSRAKKENLLKRVEEKYQVTNKGKLKIISELKKGGSTWDGKWRLIFFDIPEGQRSKRDLLRRKLKELGFVQHQYSAWISPYNYSEEIDVIISELEIEDYVKYLVGESILGGDELKEIFNLK